MKPKRRKTPRDLEVDNRWQPSSDAQRIRVPTAQAVLYRHNLAPNGNDCVARESAKGLDEEMKIVTALSPMLGAARAQMVATHGVFGVPELSKLQEPGGSSQDPGRVIEYCRVVNSASFSLDL